MGVRCSEAAQIDLPRKRGLFIAQAETLHLDTGSRCGPECVGQFSGRLYLLLDGYFRLSVR
jgi:hypothetical protein